MTTVPISGSGEHAVYTGRTTSWPMVASSSLGAVLVVVMARRVDGPLSDLAVPLLLVAIGVLANVLTASSVRATAGPNGFTVHWGLIGWPRCDYRLDEIENADVIDLPWWKVTSGFWWTLKRTFCTVRNGPALRLRLRSGRIVTVTVPEPVVAVAALRAASGSVEDA